MQAQMIANAGSASLQAYSGSRFTAAASVDCDQSVEYILLTCRVVGGQTADGNSAHDASNADTSILSAVAMLHDRRDSQATEHENA